MKKYGMIVIVFLVLLAVCCEDFSDFFLEEYSAKESRGIETIRAEVTTEEIYRYLTPVFSVEAANPSLGVCSNFFDSGKIPVPSSIILETHLHFWEDPLFMKPLFLSQVEAMRKAKEKEKQKQEEEAKKASLETEAVSPSSSFASQYPYVPTEANSWTIEIEDKTTPLLVEDNSQPTLSFRLDSISLESDEGSSLSYSLNGGPFREYSEPIDIKDDSSLTVKSKEQGHPSFFLSSKVTVTIDEAP